jgi:hypothetical protein
MPAIVDTPYGSRPLTAMRKRATRRRVAPRPRPAPVHRTPSFDNHAATARSDARKVATFKQTPAYRGAIRKAYNTRSISSRHQALTYARAHPSPEGNVTTRLHANLTKSDQRQKKNYGYLVRQVYGRGKNAALIAKLENSPRRASRGPVGDNHAATADFDNLRIAFHTSTPHYINRVRQAALSNHELMAAPTPQAKYTYAVDPSTGRATKSRVGDIGPRANPTWFTKLLGKAGGNTKSSVLFALHQISRLGAGIASGSLEGSRKNSLAGPLSGVDLGDYAHGFKEGFVHPEEHMHDWNRILERQGVKNKKLNAALAFTYGVATDPTTYATLGAGGAAKTAAIKAYEHTLESGGSEIEAVQAARKVWDAAPASKQISGLKVGIRGTPALIASRGRTTHLESGPIGAGTAALIRAAARKAGVTNIRPMGVATDTIRNNVNKIAPRVRPAGWEKIDWELARRAGRKSRAGEREAQRHASYRLRAFTHATKDWTEDEHRAVIDAIERGSVAALPSKLRPVAEQIEREMGHAFSQRVSAGLSKPLAPGSRVGVGAPPVAPVFNPSGTAQRLAQDVGFINSLPKGLQSTALRQHMENARALGLEAGRPDRATKADVKLSARELNRLRRQDIGARRELADLQHQLGVSQGRAEILSRNVAGTGAARKRAENLPIEYSGERGAEAIDKLRARTMIKTGKRGTAQDVSRYIDQVMAAHERGYSGGGLGVNMALHAMHDAEQKAAQAATRLDEHISQHEALKTAAKGQRKTLRDYEKALAKWEAAPAGFFPRVLAPDAISESGQRFGRGSGTIGNKKRILKQRLADLDPEARAKFEQRVPQAVAQYAVQHGRKMNMSKLNERIAAMGHEVDPNQVGLSNLVGKKMDLYENAPTGLHPLFDKYGVVDAEAVQKAVQNGNKIVEVDHRMADAVRSLARGQRELPGNLPPELAMAIDQSSGVLGGYDRMQRRLKVLQTSVNPAYHVVNLIGDSFNAVIGGARPRDFAAGKRLRKIESALKRADLELDPMTATGRLHKANPLSRTTKDILDKARGHVEKYGARELSDLDIVTLGVAHGALRTGLTSGELRAASRGAALATEGGGVIGKGMERLQNVSDWREDLVRLTTFRSALKRGMSPDDAAEWANRHHFDYADLSPTEQKFFRRVIPFWTFTARNTPLQVRSLAARPGVFATEEKGRAQSAYLGDLPPDFATRLREFEQTGAPWGTPFRFALKDTKADHIDAPVTLYPKLPMMDLANIPFPQDTSEGKLSYGNTFQEAGMNLMNRVTPFAKIPLEQIFGLNTFTGTKQQDVVQAPSWWVKMGLPSTPYQDPRTGKMVRGVSWRLLEPLQSTPVTNMLSRQGTSTLHGQPESGNLKWAGWLAGPRPAIQDPRVVKINRLYERVDQLSKEITNLEHRVKHNRGDQWHGKIGKKINQRTELLHQIYDLSARTGAKKPAGIPRAKPRNRKPKGIGAGFGGGFSTGGTGATIGGGFR